MSRHDLVNFISTYSIDKVKKVKEVEMHFSQFSLLMIIYSFVGQELMLQSVDRNFNVCIFCKLYQCYWLR